VFSSGDWGEVNSRKRERGIGAVPSVVNPGGGGSTMCQRGRSRRRIVSVEAYRKEGKNQNWGKVKLKCGNQGTVKGDSARGTGERNDSSSFKGGAWGGETVPHLKEKGATCK